MSRTFRRINLQSDSERGAAVNYLTCRDDIGAVRLVREEDEGGPAAHMWP